MCDEQGARSRDLAVCAPLPCRSEDSREQLRFRTVVAGLDADARPPAKAREEPGRRMRCGTWLTVLDKETLIRELSRPSAAHRLVVPCRGHQRVVWHGVRGVQVSYLRRGAITVIPAACSGRLELDEDTGFYCVHLAVARMATCASTLGHVQVPETTLRIGAADARTASIVELLSDGIRYDDMALDLIRERAVDLLCLQLIRHHSSARVQSERHRRGLATWHIRKIAEFVEPRLGSPLTLDDLASHVGLSRYHFCTAFKRATGTSPNEWLTIKRIDRAAVMLVRSDASVADIALSVGYGTPSAFSACFRRVMGMTPTAYRRQAAPAPVAPIHP